VKKISGAAKRYPQMAYAGLARSLQQEWQHLQRVIPQIAPLFDIVDHELKNLFLPSNMPSNVKRGASSISAMMRSKTNSSISSPALSLSHVSLMNHISTPVRKVLK